MKKFNKNALLFVFFAMFIIWGIQGDMFLGLIHDAKSSGMDVIKGKFESLNTLKDKIDERSSENLSYHSQMMDVNSVKDNLLGTRVVKKGDGVLYVKSDSDSIIIPEQSLLVESDFEKSISNVNELKTVSEQNGAKFLYCAVPSKANYEVAPSNIANYEKENYDRFIGDLEKAKIPCLDYSDYFRESSASANDIYFYTDHHWRPIYGFNAAGQICKELNLRYGFQYNESLTDIKNYQVETYKNHFLGSYGKKVGTYFSWVGAEDFDVITPKFQTDFIEEQPFKNQTKSGDFASTLLYKENLKKNYYNVNTYATYGGGDFRLQIIKNNLNQEGKTILIIRDSFACVVTPFLALHAKELHVCDMRDMEGMVGDKMNMKEYINQIKPDYVICFYTRFGFGNDSRFNFFDSIK